MIAITKVYKKMFVTLMRDLTLPDNFIIEYDLVPVPEEDGGRRS